MSASLPVENAAWDLDVNTIDEAVLDELYSNANGNSLGFCQFHTNSSTEDPNKVTICTDGAPQSSWMPSTPAHLVRSTMQEWNDSHFAVPLDNFDFDLESLMESGLVDASTAQINSPPVFDTFEPGMHHSVATANTCNQKGIYAGGGTNEFSGLDGNVGNSSSSNSGSSSYCNDVSGSGTSLASQVQFATLQVEHGHMDGCGLKRGAVASGVIGDDVNSDGRKRIGGECPHLRAAKDQLAEGVYLTLPNGAICSPFLDLRLAAPVLFEGIPLRLLSEEDRQELISRLVSMLTRQDRLKWKKKSTNYSTSPDTAGESTTTLLCCSRNGKPDRKLSRSVPLRQAVCLDCECPAKAAVRWFDNTFEILCSAHKPECAAHPLQDSWFKNSNRHFLAETSPQKVQTLKHFAQEIAQRDTQVPKTVLVRQLCAEATSILSCAAPSSTKPLSHLTQCVIADPCRKAAPKNLLRKLAGEAIEHATGNVSRENALPQLVENLSSLGITNYTVHTQVDAHGNHIACALSYIDPFLAPLEGTPMYVLTADVTFGVTEERDGFPGGVSFFTNVSPRREAQIIAVTVLTNENTNTFEKECELVAASYPQLLCGTFVLIVDGDQARIRAVLLVFPNCLVLLCLHHTNNNFIKHFGKRRTVADPSATTPTPCYYAHCVRCGKARAVATELVQPMTEKVVEFLQNFTCMVVQKSCVDEHCDVALDEVLTEEHRLECVATSDVTSASAAPQATLLKVQSISPPNDAVRELGRLGSDAGSVYSWLRRASTPAQLEERLCAMDIVFPTVSGANYTDYLRQKQTLWAEMYRSWEVTFGLAASSLQEGVHSSLKAELISKKRSVRLFELPLLIRQVMKNRIENRAGIAGVTVTTLSQEKMLEGQGCNKLLLSLKLLLSTDGYYMTLGELVSATGYDAECLPVERVDSTLQSVCQHRNASAQRYATFLISLGIMDTTTNTASANNTTTTNTTSNSTTVSSTNNEITSIGTFYLVTARSKSGQKDIVYVHTDGSLCSTNQDMHRYGCPRQVELSLFLAGYIPLNPLLHWLDIYHANSATLSEAPEIVLDHTIWRDSRHTNTTSGSTQSVLLTCSPTFGRDTTASAWRDQIRGTATVKMNSNNIPATTAANNASNNSNNNNNNNSSSNVIRSNTTKLHVTPGEWEEQLMKDFRQHIRYLARNETQRTAFYQLLATHSAERASAEKLRLETKRKATTITTKSIVHTKTTNNATTTTTTNSTTASKKQSSSEENNTKKKDKALSASALAATNSTSTVPTDKAFTLTNPPGPPKTPKRHKSALEKNQPKKRK